MAKKATQDGLVHCFCEGMDAKDHANTKRAKERLKRMSYNAFGRNISEGLLCQLQNPRHQLFVRTEGTRGKGKPASRARTY